MPRATATAIVSPGKRSKITGSTVNSIACSTSLCLHNPFFATYTVSMSQRCCKPQQKGGWPMPDGPTPAKLIFTCQEEHGWTIVSLSDGVNETSVLGSYVL